MLSKIVFLFLVYSVSCFNFKPRVEQFLESNEIQVTQAKVSDCGDDSSAFHLADGKLIPDPLVFPGNASLFATLKVLQDMPEKDVSLKVVLKKDFPPITVPCTNNFGSCTYDMCKDFLGNAKVNETLCPQTGICGCPVKANTYEINSVGGSQSEIPGGAFVEGGYHMTANVMDKAGKGLGCISVTFSIKRRN